MSASSCPLLCSATGLWRFGGHLPLPLSVPDGIWGVGQVALWDVGPLNDEGLQRVIEAQPLLTRLQLGPCTSLTEVLVSAIVLKLPHLTHLALSGCSLLSDGALVCIAEGLPSLKSLLLTEGAGFADPVRLLSLSPLIPIPAPLRARLPQAALGLPLPPRALWLALWALSACSSAALCPLARALLPLRFPRPLFVSPCSFPFFALLCVVLM